MITKTSREKTHVSLDANNSIRKCLHTILPAWPCNQDAELYQGEWDD